MRVACLVGIERYRRLSEARHARNDAVQLRAALAAMCGFDECRLLAEETGSELLRGSLSDWGSKLGPDDTFLLYFAGHGVEIDRVPLLLGWDAALDVSSGLDALPLENAIALAVATGAGRTAVICDCCREHPLTGRGGPADNLMTESMDQSAMAMSRKIVARGGAHRNRTAILLGCSPGQRTWAADREPHGAFTACLIDGLSGKAAAADGSLTMHSLAEYASRRMDEWTQLNPARPMTPHFTAFGSIVLSTRAAAGANHRLAAPDRRFRFSTGDVAVTLEAWLDWLADHPYQVAAELRLHPELEAWLGGFVSNLAAAGFAQQLRAQTDGVWSVLFRLAVDGAPGAKGLVERLRARTGEIVALCAPARSAGEYFSAQRRHEEAARLDPHSAMVATARLELERVVERLSFDGPRRAALDEAARLAAVGRRHEALERLGVLHRAAGLGAAEAGAVESFAGAAEIVEQDGFQWIRVPEGVFRTSSGRLVGVSAFRITRSPVTVREYLRDAPRPAVSPPGNPEFVFDSRPMVFETWPNVEAFCLARGGALPSEAQWESLRLRAADVAVWPGCHEWCRDVFRTPERVPAWDPLASGGPNELRVVRNPNGARYGAPPGERSDRIAFRLAMPE